jgi:hypothetical protein
VTVVYRYAVYSPEGALLEASRAFPLETPPRAQPVADLIARAAESSCERRAGGTIAVWMDPDVQPLAWLEQAAADAIRSFGPGQQPVPQYSWEHTGDHSITLIPL